MSKTMEVGKAMPDKKPKEPPEVNFRWPKGATVQPGGFKGLGTSEEVTIVVKGKVTRIEDNPDREWDPGKSLSIKMTSCEIQGPPAEKVSLDQAIDAGAKRI